MKRIAKSILFVWACFLGAQAKAIAQRNVEGVVVRVDASHHSIDVSCAAIPGYMDAMEMTFTARTPTVLSWLKPGASIRFQMVNADGKLYADGIQAIANFDPEPAEAGGLLSIDRVMHAQDGEGERVGEVRVGELVPDFALLDQARNTIRLSSLRGRVVAITFGYSRCPYPQYCFRLSNNLGQLEKRFHARMGRDLVLLTIAIDPDHDQGDVLSTYAASFKANPETWHFLTGTVAQIREVGARFGLRFWTGDGLITHTLHTVVIDRQGRLSANLEGNAFTPGQLGDVVESVMNNN
jgi:protein SCO1/2